jgi:hypothetical protein
MARMNTSLNVEKRVENAEISPASFRYSDSSGTETTIAARLVLFEKVILQ